MPHLTLEYSANLEDALDIDALVGALHETALGCPTFGPQAVRTRAVRRDSYRVADGAAENGFLVLNVGLLEGRADEVKAEIADRLFATLETRSAEIVARGPVALSVLLYEIDGASMRSGGSISRD